MNLEKFTDRAKGFIQSAQTVAIRMNHQRITPEHLLKALLEDGEGMASGLIQRAGGNAQIAQARVDEALAKIPAVSGSGAQAATAAEQFAGPAAPAGTKAHCVTIVGASEAPSSRFPDVVK